MSSPPLSSPLPQPAAPAASNGRVLVSRHPLVAHKICLLRDATTPPSQFRLLVKELSSLLAYEATAKLPVQEEQESRQSPTGAAYHGVKIGPKIGLVPIMRAGTGMVEAFLDLVPGARVHHIGIFREKSTLQPVEYYNKLPATVNIDQAIVLDPLVATAGTAIATVNIIKDWGVPGKHITLVAIVASAEGIDALHAAHPDITVHVAAVDEVLNSKGYVVPGVGDAGDRLFNTPH